MIERRGLRTAGLRAVLERDFLVYTSRPRFLLLRTLIVVLPAFVLVTALSTTGPDKIARNAASMGQTIFTIALAMLPPLTMLLAPILSASCIASERALNTLQIVLVSPVSPLAFVFAKFASRAGVALVLVFATLPLAGLCFLYGGVSATSFVDLVVFLVGLSILGTAAGILASAWSRSVATAALLSYVFCFAVPLFHVVALIPTFRSIPDFFGGNWLANANPFQVWSKLGLGIAVSGGVTPTVRPALEFIVWTCVFAAIAIIAAGWRLSGEAGFESTAGTARRRPFSMRFANPVLDRAIRGSLFHRPRTSAWLSLLFLVAADGLMSGLTLSHDLFREAWPHIIFLDVATFACGLRAMTATAHSIASERETGALEMLFATRLTTGEIVRGKLAGCVTAVLPLLAFALLHGLVVAALTKLHLTSVIGWFAGALLVTTLMAAVGLWASAGARSSGRAVLLSYALLIGGSVVHAVAFAVAMVGISHLGRFGDHVAMYLAGASPLFVGIAPGLFGEVDRWDSNDVNAFVAWVLWAAIYVVVIAVLLASARHTLEKRNEAS